MPNTVVTAPSLSSFKSSIDGHFKRFGEAIREAIREGQLKFIGHCIRMTTDEPTNRFVIYESKIRSSLRPGAPKKTFLNKISSNILSSESP